MSEINGNSEKHLASIDGLQVCITPSITADQLEGGFKYEAQQR